VLTLKENFFHKDTIIPTPTTMEMMMMTTIALFFIARDMLTNYQVPTTVLAVK
jgi:hypothetical protein